MAAAAAKLQAFNATNTKVTLILRDNTPADTSDNPKEDLLEPIAIPGTALVTAKRVFIEFTSETEIYDSDGSVKGAFFVPDFLLQEPSSLTLKGDETKDLGASENIFEEYLWLMKINAPRRTWRAGWWRSTG